MNHQCADSDDGSGNEDELRKKGFSLSLMDVGLLMFRGTDPILGCNGYHDAFNEAFSEELNVGSWKKIGAAPLTHACLHSSKV